jgi:hypothetical protein
MQVDFGARNLPMARIAAHIQEIHPTFFEFCELSGISTHPKRERDEAHRSLGWTGQVQAE